MLQFWKKSGHKDKTRFNTPSTSSCIVSNENLNRIDSSFESPTGPLSLIEDEGLFDLSDCESPKQNSRLTKSLAELLEDKSALGYFEQFLESRNTISYLHCWFEIKLFKNEAQTLRESVSKVKKSMRTHSPLCSTKIDHDSLSVSTDCDSYTGDSSSLCDFSTGDAKSPVCDRVAIDVSNGCDKSSDASQSNHMGSEKSTERNSKAVINKDLQLVVDNALLIFKKYISLEANESIKCPEQIRKGVIENICDTEKILNCTCFEKVEEYLYDILENDCFVTFVGSDFFCKHQIDVLTSGNVVLEDILYNETALFYFMEFLEQENQRSLLEFWIAANNLQLQLNEQKEFFDPIEAQNDAVVLYDKYFSLQAHCPLGFSDKIRFAVEQSICGENGIVVDCFHLPLKIVEQVLERNYLKSFIASQLFYKYLSELINSVHSTSYFNVIDGYKCSPSDCGSEKSFSTNSTFLAMQVPKSGAKSIKDKRSTDMHIDTRQLYDPDSLWKRKKIHRLSLGRVTALGKYETDFEPEPDKKSQSKLKNVVKKLVNLEEDSKKEEMAWQVAEMIVKDITSITLTDQK